MDEYSDIRTGPRRKSREETKRDVMALLMGDDPRAEEKNTNTTLKLNITDLEPFANHPFKLYEGDRLDDMVQSITNLGVIVPIVVRPQDEYDLTYEILSGHNRVNAAKIAGLTKVPAVIMKGLTDEDAALIDIETNLIQRSFSDLSHSERAIALKFHMDTIKSQGKRTDLIEMIETLSNPHETKGNGTSALLEPKLSAREKTAEQYGLCRANVTRYLRLTNLNKSMLHRVDNDEIGLYPAVSLSYLSTDEQTELDNLLNETEYKVDMKKAESLREFSESKKLTSEKMEQILSGEMNMKPKPRTAPPFKLKAKIYQKYFDSSKAQGEIETTIDQALMEYFDKHKQKEEAA
jgi:ParB family chromosome partitioning protein